jgi:hypothetical protein
MTDYGTVISNSAKNQGVAEEWLWQFREGKEWRIEPLPSALPWQQVLHRARSMPRKPYNLLAWNCESFVSECFGLPAKSSQVENALLAAAVRLLALAAVSAD